VLASNVLYPKSYEEFSEIVRESINGKKRILVIGYGKHLIGKPKADIIVSTRMINRILEVSQADLYVTAQAGISLRELNEELKKQGLWLPFDYDGTLGGLTATNLPLWYTYPRELLLGAKFVNGEGNVLKSGGKTTKFSSGYKIWKVLAGSLGKLGIILEVTYRVFPLPEVVTFAKFDYSELRRVFDYSPLAIMVIIRNDGEMTGIAKFAGLRKVIERIPLAKDVDVELCNEGDRVISIISPLGLEVEYARKAREFINVECSVSLVGRGYTRAYVKDFNGIENARSSGIMVMVERGEYDGEHIPRASNAFTLLKRALDPYGVFG